MTEWVGQADAYGCGFACLAMVTGRTYQRVVDELATDRSRVPGCEGIIYTELDQYLTENGYAVARKWRWHRGVERAEWPPAPFGDVHLAEQAAPAHFVVVLGDGTVLDPQTPTPRRLADIEPRNLNWMAAVVRR